jgi:hypothetical protein
MGGSRSNFQSRSRVPVPEQHFLEQGVSENRNKLFQEGSGKILKIS